MNRFLLIAFGFLPFCLHAQPAAAGLYARPAGHAPYMKNYFISPLDIAWQLAGNFGELRPNHFHTGVDITTHGAEGLPVKAAAEGYVSRIKVGPWGYGKVVYITHPNGFTTVYGHLSHFSPALDAYIKKNQYSKEAFEVELFPAPTEFAVKQGEVIAYSGNTGSSGGPHLHFEVRDTKTEEAINPLLFGFPVKDAVAPVPVSLLVSPAGPSDVVNGQNSSLRFMLKKSGTDYVLANPADSIVCYGKIGFAIEGYDTESSAHGKNGVYSIRLEKGKQLIYSSRIERIPFEKSRFINCFIDYREHEKRNVFFMRSFLLPNNQLPLYDSVVNEGYCIFNSDSTFRFRYSLGDIYGNLAQFSFKAKSLKKQPPYKDVVRVQTPFTQVLLWDTANLFEDAGYRFETPAGAFYENGIFSCNITKSSGADKSSLFSVGDPYFPIQKECELTINTDLPAELQPKALIVQLNAKGRASAVGGSWAGKGVKAGIKEFGTYCVRIDTTGPRITTANFDLKGRKQSDLSAYTSLKFTIGDNLSGISGWRGTLDGNWVLVEYEPKKKMLWYSFDENTGKGAHEFILELTDKCGNKTVYKKNFTR